MDSRKADAADHLTRLSVLVFGFAGKARQNVGCQRGMGINGPQTVYRRQILGGVVAPLHAGQNGIAS